MPSTRRRPPLFVRILVVAGALAGLGYLIYARTRPNPKPAAAATASETPGSADLSGSAGSAGSAVAPEDRRFYGTKYLGNAR